MLTRPEIKERAKAAVAANRGLGIGAYVVFVIVITAVSGISFGLGGLIIVPAMCVGYAYFSIRYYLMDAGITVGDIFTKGFENFGRNLGGILWMILWVYLWSLLFIIPGIIKSYAYCMTPYILANEPAVSATDALKLSMRMTEGHKWEIFVLQLSFLGWQLLSVLTLGILEIVWVGPYESAAMAGLYLELRENAVRSGIITEAEFAGEHF